MYNVVISFGNFPTRFRDGRPGPYTEEELGIMWLKHVAQFSEPGMLAKYRLVLLLPREVLIPEDVDLSKWGEKKRIDDNNSTQPWPIGPNMAFQQILWCYVHGKLEGPFLWCEPDCVPVKPDWLDQLFAEYERVGKPFMGNLVESFISRDGFRTPKHMTGNAIYSDKAYAIAPRLLECRGTAWDVFAAREILLDKHFHQTSLIQHELNDQANPSLDPNAVLYHPEKFGRLIKRLNGDVPSLMAATGLGKPLFEIFSEPEPSSIDTMLDQVRLACRDDREIHRKVAYYMIDNGIVSDGFWRGAKIKGTLAKKKTEAAHAGSPE